MHIKSVYPCCCCFFFFIIFLFYYFLILRCIYTLQAYRYRRVKKIVVHQLSFIIDFRPIAASH